MRRTNFIPVQPASAFGSSAKAISISGFDEITKNFNAVANDLIQNTSKKGLLEIAKFIRRDMDINQPYIPFDLGNLEASWRVFGPYKETEGKQSITFGFIANYALWVHEMMGDVNWSKPGSGPKFFEKAINRNHDTMIQIMVANTKIP